MAPAAEVSQRRVGRINLSRLRGPGPGYPKLPSLRGGDEVDSASDEDLVDLSDRLTEVKFDRKDKVEEVTKEGEATDEFDDSELEQALQDLSIDSDGTLQRVPAGTARTQQDSASTRQEPVAEDDTGTKQMKLSDEADTATDEEQRLIDLINDPEIAAYLHDPPTNAPTPATSMSAPSIRPSEPSAPPPVAPIASPAAAIHTPEYTQATAWARSYLSSTIPPHGSLTPSHIRATVPHLRAYHMWHHQQLPLDEIAQQVRDPPLAASTVASYVLQAITLERMEYDASAVRGLLTGMPEALRSGKWKGLAEKVGAR